MSPPARWILHVDMDEFFAAVERLDDPSLAGKCLLVGGDPDARGVVSTASYEARKFGCHSAMPMRQAVRRCPQAVVLPVRGARYAEVSQQIFEIFTRFTPAVEPLSIDEAFLDVTGTERLLGTPPAIARRIKQLIHDELGLIASVGVATNKFLAKLASDLEKPDSLTVIPPDDVQRILDPLPVRKLWGVGPTTAQRLNTKGIRTIGQLRQIPVSTLTPILGNAAAHFLQLAHGQDSRPVITDTQAKSIGQETTFTKDLASRDELLRVLLGQVEQVARRLRISKLFAKTLTIKLREGDFTTLTRSVTFENPTWATEAIWQAAKALFTTWARAAFCPLRLLGVTASNLTDHAGGQLGLFDQPQQKQSQKDRQLDAALDTITTRFGPGAVGRGK